LPYVGVLALLLSVANSVYQRRKDQQGDWTTKISDAVGPYRGLPDAISEIRAELQVLKKQVEVFWKGVSFSSAQALHSPHTKELDELLEKFQRDEIQSEKDLEKLKLMLRDVVENDPSPMRKKFALDILTLIHVRFEIGGDLVTAMRQAN
jgi:hypothetical protein